MRENRSGSQRRGERVLYMDDRHVKKMAFSNGPQRLEGDSSDIPCIAEYRAVVLALNAGAERALAHSCFFRPSHRSIT